MEGAMGGDLGAHPADLVAVWASVLGGAVGQFGGHSLGDFAGHALVAVGHGGSLKLGCGRLGFARAFIPVAPHGPVVLGGQLFAAGVMVGGRFGPWWRGVAGFKFAVVHAFGRCCNADAFVVLACAHACAGAV